MTYQSINPANGKTLKTFKELTDKPMETRRATAATGVKAWKNTSHKERAAIVATVTALMKAQVDDFAKLLTLGKLHPTRGADFPPAAQVQAA